MTDTQGQITGDEEKQEFAKLDSGTYTCVLHNIKDCTRFGGSRIDGKWVTDKSVTKPAKRFVFKVLDVYNGFICHTVNVTQSEKGGLFKTLQNLTNNLQRDLINERGYVDDDKQREFESRIERLKGRVFYVTAERKGDYINYKSAEPAPDDAAPSVGAGEKALNGDSVVAHDDGFENSDIPI